jgi:hypothetical protein
LVLRVLSEVAGLLLATTIAGTFEEIQWMLIGRNAHGPGLSFTDYLGLDPGTGVLGLFNLFLGTRIRKFSSSSMGCHTANSYDSGTIVEYSYYGYGFPY